VVSRENLIAEAVLDCLGKTEGHKRIAASIGVVVDGISDLDLNEFISQILQIQNELYVCAIGYPLPHGRKGLVVANNIESAVKWRNDSRCAGKIVVFLGKDVAKRRSLEKFARITDRDISVRLIRHAKDKLTANEQEAEFWMALEKEQAKFPLKLIESFVKGVSLSKGPKENERIPLNLWHLGLVFDKEIVSRNRNARERIARNRQAIEEIGQLSEQSRKRMTQVISTIKGKQKKEYENAFQTVMDYFKRNDRSCLKDLDLEILEVLIKSGKPLPKSKGPITADEAVREFDSPKNETPLKGKRLIAEIADLIVSQDPEILDELSEFGEQLQEIYKNPGSTADDIRLNDKAIVAPVTDSQLELSQSIAFCCTEKNWGGWFESDSATISQALVGFQAESFSPHDPNSDSGAGISLVELFESFDKIVKSDVGFKETFKKLSKARENLVEFVPVLTSHPLVPIATNPAVRKNVKEYLKHYEDLLALYHRAEAALHSKNAQANRLAISELLRLDIIHIFADNEWKAVLTPLHPFFLWRFVEVVETIRPGSRKLSEDERAVLGKAIQDVPQLLHFLVSSPVKESANFKPLPLAGSIQQLPTYENDTNRYLGADGTDFISEAITLWLGHAPYSISQIRLAIIDPPKSQEVLEQLVDFLDDNPDSALVVDVFKTRKGNETADFGVGGLIKNNHRFSELQTTGRLTLRIHPEIKIDQLSWKLANTPVHLCFSFDQGSYECHTAPRAKHLVVSPLVVTYQYEYDETLKRGTISPSVDTDKDGLFSDYHFMIRRISDLGPDCIPRLQTGQPPNVKILKEVIASELTQWLICADRDLSAYLLGDETTGAMQLLQKRVGQREVGVWSRTSERTMQAVTKFLEKHPINEPNEKILREIFRQYWHIAATGWSTLLKAGSQLENYSAQKALKGALGTIFAAAWYVDRYPGALVATLDSELALQWLVGRESSQKRADLIGFRTDPQTGGVVIEPIEVKAHSFNNEARFAKDKSGKLILSGKGFEQLEEIISVLRPIFGNEDKQPLFTNARREALKYQLHRECFRDAHRHEEAQRWYEILQGAFTLPTPTISVTIQGLVISVKFEELLDAKPRIIRDSKRRELALVEFGTRELQRILSGKEEVLTENDDWEQEYDNFELDFDEEEKSPSKNSPSANKPSKTMHITDPTATLMPDPATEDDVEELARSFRRACGSFAIRAECESEDAIMGPNVIRFYVKLGRGQRIGKLRDSLEDIGREMRRSNLVVTSIHNSDQIALDIPRTDKQPVLIQSVLETIPQIESIEQLPIPIGITPEGKDIIVDLAKMPHMLVAGTTGAGKTVFLYGLIASLLLKHPDSSTLRILLSSSKREDFSVFKGVKHFEGKGVIAEASKTIDIFQKRVQKEIAERSDILEANNCRDIAAFNRQYEDPIPPFVIIIDEFADLSDQLGTNRKARNEFYTAIRQVAQAGRSRGVHLVLCTQRPSAQLLPTDIRSLMNLSVAFRMKKREDSQMIIEEPGAEHLQMQGDLLMKDDKGVRRALGYFTDLAYLRSLISSLA
jgi:hypothetical protein